MKKIMRERKPAKAHTYNCASDAKTIVNSLNNIYKKVDSEGLSEDAANEIAEDIKHVSEHFDICPKAAVLLAAIMENGVSTNCDEEFLAQYIGCSNLEFFGFHDPLREMENKAIISKSNGRRRFYGPTHEALKAVEQNTAFTPVKSTGLNSEDLFSRIRKCISDFSNDSIDAERLHTELVNLIENNSQLLFCRKVMDSALWTDKCNDTDRLHFFYICHRYVSHGNQAVPVDILTHLIDIMDDEQRVLRWYANEKTGLQINGLVSFGNENGFADNQKISLSDEVKASFFCEIDLAPEEKIENKDLIHWETIPEQQLFYNKKEEEGVSRLAKLLDEENFKTVQMRLMDQGMPKGFSCVFHGCAGSGKTATLKALARQTKRDLFWVDLSSIKSKWVGESEKQVKALFDNYRNLVRTSERTPILAVNEADAIFNKRITSVEQSIDQMNNAITDIILNELESLDGILIATTNLVGNMMGGRDNAMERRFLYKIEFNAPDEEVRQQIWRSKLPHLNDEEVKNLAAEFNISGGNIDNIARKSVVDYVISGEHADFTQLQKYCSEETLTKKVERRRIGF